MSFQYDLVIIGSGPGGYVAAIRAGQLGLKTALVEKDAALGGTCLHRGCIPTKAWLHTASLLNQIASSESFGVVLDAQPRVDLERAANYRKGVIDKNARGIEYLLRKSSVETLHGVGSLIGEHGIEVRSETGSQRYEAESILVATGSRPRTLPIAPIDGRATLDSDQILELDRIPGSLIVLGGGAVGCEFASIYNSLGSEVTLVELLPRLLSFEDSEVSDTLAKSLTRRGIDVRLASRVTSVTGSDPVRVEIERDGQIEVRDAEQVLVAVGRSPCTQGLGLEALGVGLDRGFVEVNEFMHTGVGAIYAIGDIVATPQLAHVASAEGILAVEHVAGLNPQPLDYDRVPSATYCEPEVASVGLTEDEARERGYEVETGRFPFQASGKAAIIGQTEGFVKVVRETRYDELLGVHIVGPHATDLIAEACVGLRVEATTEELFRTIHAHPTLSEAVSEAALAASGRGIHA